MLFHYQPGVNKLRFRAVFIVFLRIKDVTAKVKSAKNHQVKVIPDRVSPTARPSAFSSN